jgi:hypothetical protein
MLVPNNDDTQDKWRLLASLESAMARRLSATCAVASIALPKAPSTTSHLDYARKMAGDPWRSSMESLVPQLQQAVADIRVAASHAPAEHADIAGDYVAHEEALLAFATAEVDGGDGAPVVRSLLHNWSQEPISASRS